MATRPVYVPISRSPFYQRIDVEFTFNAGFSVAQKQRNVEAIHRAFIKKRADSSPLEISSKSKEPLGVSLSAFNLKKYIPSLKIKIPVENVYQGGKNFSSGGAFTDLYYVTPKEAKRDERLSNSGTLRAFSFEGVNYPTEPKNGFYNWVYISALLENEDLAEEILKYDAFTDVEFNPNRSTNCQAQAAAMFVGITQVGLIESTRDFYDFCKLISERSNATVTAHVEEAKNEAEPQTVEFSEGDIIRHPTFGEGKIIEAKDGRLKVNFPSGEKTLGAKWTGEHCTR